jgi:hypothetical protein
LLLQDPSLGVGFQIFSDLLYGFFQILIFVLD